MYICPSPLSHNAEKSSMSLLHAVNATFPHHFFNAHGEFPTEQRALGRNWDSITNSLAPSLDTSEYFLSECSKITAIIF